MRRCLWSAGTCRSRWRSWGGRRGWWWHWGRGRCWWPPRNPAEAQSWTEQLIVEMETNIRKLCVLYVGDHISRLLTVGLRSFIKVQSIFDIWYDCIEGRMGLTLWRGRGGQWWPWRGSRWRGTPRSGRSASSWSAARPGPARAPPAETCRVDTWSSLNWDNHFMCYGYYESFPWVMSISVPPTKQSFSPVFRLQISKGLVKLRWINPISIMGLQNKVAISAFDL